MNKPFDVPKGKDVANLWVKGHTYLRLIDSEGKETFRSDSPGEHASAIVKPGSYTIETDGKLGKVELASLEPRHRPGRGADSTKPPMPKG